MEDLSTWESIIIIILVIAAVIPAVGLFFALHTSMFSRDYKEWRKKELDEDQ